ncbi:MAG: RluA family pseudouridine synthase [Planctomycetota bacterium]
MADDRRFEINAYMDGMSLASALKRLLPDRSWSQVKRLIATRRVCINGTLCLDEARRLTAGDRVEVFEHSRRPLPSATNVRVVHQDDHILVVDKPAGIVTVRRPEERGWPARRKAMQPTLDELVRELLSESDAARQPAGRAKTPWLRAAHRLDRDTSGLALFALSPAAQLAMVRMFAKREIERAYLAVVHGHPRTQTIETWLVRDRGDGLRGSSPRGAQATGGKQAVTHLRPVERIGDLSLVECRLETGRTHQIRIHLCEIGHVLCGEKVYTHRLGEPPRPDASGAPRQALHSAELRFAHPVTGKGMEFSSPLPADLAGWLRTVC